MNETICLDQLIWNTPPVSAFHGNCGVGPGPGHPCMGRGNSMPPVPMHMYSQDKPLIDDAVREIDLAFARAKEVLSDDAPGQYRKQYGDILIERIDASGHNDEPLHLNMDLKGYKPRDCARILGDDVHRRLL